MSHFTNSRGIIVPEKKNHSTIHQSSYNVRGAAVSAAPFDLIKSSPKFSGTIFNRVIYDSNFLRSLKRKAEVQYELLGEHGVPYRINQVKSAQSIAEFEVISALSFALKVVIICSAWLCFSPLFSHIIF